MNKYAKKNHNAFTLAEVLITLGIIGVVAAMTIPTLMNKTNDAEMKAGWKKAYSVFSQATMQMASDNGGSLSGAFVDSSDLMDKSAQYLRQSKVCTDAIAEGCRAAVMQFLTRDGVNRANGNGKGIILADGTYFQLWLSDANCKQAIGTPVVFYRCGAGIVDVNGPKKPNVFGVDIFEFHLLENKLLPYGAQGDGYDPATDCISTGSGEGCSAKYLLGN